MSTKPFEMDLLSLEDYQIGRDLIDVMRAQGK